MRTYNDRCCAAQKKISNAKNLNMTFKDKVTKYIVLNGLL